MIKTMQKNYKQLRIPFPDYTPEQQERDANSRKVHKPTLFVLKVDGVWAHLDFDLKYKFYENKNLFQMYNEIKESHPNHNLKYIINQGLENYLRDMKKREAENNKLQLMINFNKQKGGKQ